MENNEYLKDIVREYLMKDTELLQSIQNRLCLHDDPVLEEYENSISEVVRQLEKIDYALNRDLYLSMLGLEGSTSLIYGEG